MEQDKRHRCSRHKKYVSFICQSHLCDYYRQLCEECQLEDAEHKSMHIQLKQAVKKALKKGSKGLMGLRAVRARKNQEQKVNINNNPGLSDIESKLNEIRKLINQKIDNFHNNIKRIYSEHVKEKLDELEQIIQKSEQLLQKQVNELEKDNPRNLHIFFKRDILYELSYYESYLTEIFVKNIRSFKTALQNDRILTLVMSFEQNLQRIFSFSKEANAHPNDHKLQQFHLLNNELEHCYLYSLNKKMLDIRKQSIASMTRITSTLLNLPEGTGYKWSGIPQSIFYPPGNCYYIVGQGNRPSKLIVKYQYLKSVEEGFFNVKSMETERCGFGICILNGQIYIIGGQNQQQGCLSRCEKFVPLYNNQVYIIHSLNQRSSRHSVITYKDKYILKFGGVRRIPPQRDLSSEQAKNYFMALPQIYSIQTQEWSLIPFKEEFKLQFNYYPSFFKVENRNFLLVLGGDPIVFTYEKYRPALQMTVEENKEEIDQIKIRVRKSKIQYAQRIYNSTIAVKDDGYTCVFLKSRMEKEGFELGGFTMDS